MPAIKKGIQRVLGSIIWFIAILWVRSFVLFLKFLAKEMVNPRSFVRKIVLQAIARIFAMARFKQRPVNPKASEQPSRPGTEVKANYSVQYDRPLDT